jgi:tetratricopeptide (TPR) repeat protein
MTAPSTQPDRSILISRLTASGQWDRLLDAAKEWLAEDPQNPRAHRCAAQALVNLDRKPEAEMHLMQALANNPRDSFAHRLLSIVQFDLRKFDRADKSIHDAIELDPCDARNWYQLAWMCYRQRDLRSGLKWATKARELEPRNPDILNLCALCGDQAGTHPALLEEVLALDPENASGHNNLGVHYLNQAKDYAKAEECFRRALTLDPTLKVARRNLFEAVKRRDRIYRALCAPRDFLFKFRNSLIREKKGNIIALIFGIIIWLFLARFFLAGLILWLGLFWPLVKFYEFLVIGDLRKKAGEVGATRGGFLGYRQWSIKVRLSLFSGVLIAFWASVSAVIWEASKTGHTGEDAKLDMTAVLASVVLIGLLVYFGSRLVKGIVPRYHSWRRSLRLRKLKTTET